MKNYRYLGMLTLLAVTLRLATDITSGKIVGIGFLTISAPIIFYPITYICGDIFTEVYGYAQARKTVWQVFTCSVIAGLLYQLVVILPPATSFDANDAYTRVLSSVPRILIAGWIGSLTGSFLNDYVMAKMKVLTNGKHLWTRTIGSTLVGEAADSVLFNTIAFTGILPMELILSSIMGGWCVKVGIEVLFTPITYKVISILKKKENEDYYDRDTNFNPFLLSK